MSDTVYRGIVDRISSGGNAVITANPAKAGEEVIVRFGRRDVRKGDEIRYKLDRPGATEGEMVVPDDYGVDGGSGDEGADESVEDVGATGEEVPPWRRHAGDSAGKTGTESETMRDVDDRE